MANNKVTVQVDFLGNVSNLNKAIDNVEQNLQKLNIDSGKKLNFQASLSSLKRYAKELESIAPDGIVNKKDIQRADELVSKLAKGFARIQNESQKLSLGDSLLPKEAINQFKTANKLVDEYITNNEKYRSVIKEIESLEAKRSKNVEKKKNLDYDPKRLGSLTRKSNKGTLTQEESAEYKVLQDKQQTSNQLSREISSAEGKLERLKNTAASVLASLSSGQGFQNLVTQLKQLGIESISADSSLDEIKQTLTTLETSKMLEAVNILQQVDNAASVGSSEVQEFGQVINKAGESVDELTSREQDIKQFTNQLLSFFSIGNTVMLFRQAVRQAVSTVKELDEVMTETAVVTDYTVSDMWGQLDKYTNLAKELGATTKGAYETMTLYFQQGLSEQEAFELGTETMKMARIAGMDYAETTDAMTAALRGFNMELNETSAQRVSDVYSELAAVTASDTQEIATAMSKTASIASMAGMEFEETATFLAKAIETTREAPENIGTAMKTIVARYSSLTQDPSTLSEELQDALNGESVDVNSVTSALSSAGINALDAKGEFRELGDVMTELSSKWGELDSMTQHYVATQFAGNRQQSRFIAMMEDYGRTEELLSSAYNSAGASEKQFEKTMDSLEAKTNQLKDSWDNFLMGLSNSDIIKGAVDALRMLLDGINALTKGFGPLTSSILKWSVAIAGIHKAKNILAALVGTFEKFEGFSDFLGKGGISNFLGSFKQNLKSIKTGEGKTGLLESLKQGLSGKFNPIEVPVEPVVSDTGKIDLSRLVVQEDIVDGMEQYVYQQETVNELKTAGNLLDAVDLALKKAGVKIEELTTAEKIKQVILDKEKRAILLEQLGLSKAQLIISKAMNPVMIALLITIGAIVAYWKLFSPEAKLEKAQKATKAAATAAEQAQTQYDELLSSLESYDEAVSTFNNLEEGTAEWAKAMATANNIVLELLDNFPELAKYLDTTDDGLLTISDEGVEALKDLQSDRVTATSGAYKLAQIRENEAQKDVNTSQTEVGVQWGRSLVDPSAAAKLELDNVTLDVESEALLKSLGSNSKIPNKSLTDENGEITADSIKDLIDATKKNYEDVSDEEFKTRTGMEADDFSGDKAEFLAEMDIAEELRASQEAADAFANSLSGDAAKIISGLLNGDNVSELTSDVN